MPYDFAGGIPDLGEFNRAMIWWENSYSNVTTIRFQSRNHEEAYLYFVVADPGFVGGVTDNVGYSGGKVTITIHPNSVNAGVIAHEIGHALGLWHEQSRADRDNYITILWANILDGEGNQFDIKSPQSTFGDYDYDSIMHYFACEFSKCDGINGHSNCACTDLACITMQVVSQYSGQQCKIGQQSHLSVMDRRAMAFRYAPPDWYFLYSKPGSAANGGLRGTLRDLFAGYVQRSGKCDAVAGAGHVLSGWADDINADDLESGNPGFAVATRRFTRPKFVGVCDLAVVLTGTRSAEPTEI